MVEKTITEIKAVEEKARQIIETAEKNKFLTIAHAKKKAETILSEAEKAAQVEAQRLIDHAKKEAEREKGQIERLSTEEIEALRYNVSPKIEEAKKLCR